MQFRLDLQLVDAEGSLIRVLGMIERRGFTAQSLQADRTADGHWHLQMVVHGQRPGPTLEQQLLKIYDCRSVSVVSMVDVAA